MFTIGKIVVFGVIFVGVIALTAATNVKQCQGGARKLNSDEIIVSNCQKGVCKLKKKTSVSVLIKFTPETDIKNLETSVQAKILELPLPFPGVDGTSACKNVFEADGETVAACPLKAGTPYVYKNSFDILDFYPQLSLVVHWALRSNNRDVVCFELPARII